MISHLLLFVLLVHHFFVVVLHMHLRTASPSYRIPNHHISSFCTLGDSHAS
ncbi:hypothetical protein GLYMA_10G078632v4 [Glycine max]|nr:hypothetical protein GLYMA_10G078632v4 [Glycine max]KAH1137270.1 hypothetical protein GYH30_027306 [Glycine max]